MKRIIALFMLLLVVFMISGCKQEEMDKKEADQQEDDTKETVENKVEETPSEDAEVLGEGLEKDDIQEDIGSADDLEVNPDEFLI